MTRLRLPDGELGPGQLFGHVDGGLCVEGEGTAPQYRFTGSQGHENDHLVLHMYAVQRQEINYVDPDPHISSLRETT